MEHKCSICLLAVKNARELYVHLASDHYGIEPERMYIRSSDEESLSHSWIQYPTRSKALHVPIVISARPIQEMQVEDIMAEVEKVL